MSFLNGAEHWFARVTHELMVVGEKVVRTEAKVEKGIEVATTIAETVDPAQAIAIAAIGSGVETIWGKVCSAIHALDMAIARGEKQIDPAQPVIIQIPADPNLLQSVRDAMQKMDVLRPGTLSVANALVSGTTPRLLPAGPAAVPAPSTAIGSVGAQAPSAHTPEDDNHLGGIVG